MPTVKLGSAWLGTESKLIELHHVSAEDVTPQRPLSPFEALDGSRRAILGEKMPRTWNVTAAGLRSDELAQVAQFIDNEPGPWWWISPVARANNLLEPEESRLRGAWALDGGGSSIMRSTNIVVTGPDGVTQWHEQFRGNGAPLTIIKNGSRSYIPAPYDVLVTASAYVQLPSANATLKLQFLTGGVVDTAFTTTTRERVADSSTYRMTVTGSIASYSRSCNIWLSADEWWSRPQITFTPVPRTWADGMGASAVVGITGPRAARTAWLDGPPNSTALSFSLTEVNRS